MHIQRTFAVLLFVSCCFWCIVACKADRTIQKKPCASQIQQLQNSKKNRIIKIKNCITPEMTRYRFWGSYYKPTSFYITIDNKQLKPDEILECSVDENNRIDITYHYEFKDGMVSGSKCIELEIPEHEAMVQITFSWNKSHRFVCSSGRTVCAKKSELKNSCNIT